jgi:hypothetical protein
MENRRRNAFLVSFQCFANDFFDIVRQLVPRKLHLSPTKNKKNIKIKRNKKRKRTLFN